MGDNVTFLYSVWFGIEPVPDGPGHLSANKSHRGNGKLLGARPEFMVHSEVKETVDTVACSER